LHSGLRSGTFVRVVILPPRPLYPLAVADPHLTLPTAFPQRSPALRARAILPRSPIRSLHARWPQLKSHARRHFRWPLPRSHSPPKRLTNSLPPPQLLHHFPALREPALQIPSSSAIPPDRSTQSASKIPSMCGTKS